MIVHRFLVDRFHLSFVLKILDVRDVEMIPDLHKILYRLLDQPMNVQMIEKPCHLILQDIEMNSD